MTTRRSTAAVEGLCHGEDPMLIAMFMHKGGEWPGVPPAAPAAPALVLGPSPCMQHCGSSVRAEQAFMPAP